MPKKLAMLQRQLELDSDLTRFQPPQVSVLNDEDGTVRCVLLTTVELFCRHQAALASRCFPSGRGVVGDPSSPLPSDVLGGRNFRISERYRCLADHRGQVQGGVGFIFEGMDMLDNSKVQQSCRLPDFFRRRTFRVCRHAKSCAPILPAQRLGPYCRAACSLGFC